MITLTTPPFISFESSQFTRIPTGLRHVIYKTLRYLVFNLYQFNSQSHGIKTNYCATKGTLKPQPYPCTPWTTLQILHS